MHGGGRKFVQGEGGLQGLSIPVPGSARWDWNRCRQTYPYNSRTRFIAEPPCGPEVARIE